MRSPRAAVVVLTRGERCLSTGHRRPTSGHHHPNTRLSPSSWTADPLLTSGHLGPHAWPSPSSWMRIAVLTKRHRAPDGWPMRSSRAACAALTIRAAFLSDSHHEGDRRPPLPSHLSVAPRDNRTASPIHRPFLANTRPARSCLAGHEGRCVAYATRSRRRREPHMSTPLPIALPPRTCFAAGAIPPRGHPLSHSWPPPSSRAIQQQP
jgi:hypothetical protein